MKIIAIMPIKLNNERLPGKNIKLLGEKPLIQYALDELLKIKMCDEIYVYCSDETICRYLPQGVTFLKREKDLDLPSSNFSQIFDRFRKEIEAEIYVYMHATAPYVSAATMKECIEKVQSYKYDSAFCVEKIQDFLWKDGKTFNFDERNLPRSQDIEPIYRETSGIYVFRKEVFEKYNSRIGDNPYMKEVNYIEAVDINTNEDFELASILLSKVNQRNG